MHTLNKPQTKLKSGTQLWRNPTNRLLKIKIFQGKNQGPKTHEVEPGGTIGLPAYWSEATCRKVCRFIEPDTGDAPTPPAPPAPPEPTPPEAAAPLGDASKVPTQDERGEPGHEDSHSAGDALEAFVSTLCKKSKPDLVTMAEGLNLATTHPDSDKVLDKKVIARAIALKSIADDEPERGHAAG